MNNEIKEILDEMINSKDYQDYKIYGKRLKEIGKLLLDYITNLQELCNKYEEEHNTTFKEWQKDIQANKRAIEYMKKNEFININNYWEAVEFYQDLLNILQNGSDSE